MGSLVKEFQRDLVQSQKSTTELLRTAKVIAVKLGLTDITAWIASELNGYDSQTVPDYRRISGGELFHFNPYRGWLPLGSVRFAGAITQPISEVEALVEERSIVLPLRREQNFPIKSDLGDDFSHWQQHIEVGPNKITGLLQAVKDRLLDWALELEQRGILGEDMSFSDMERKSAQTQNFHIQHFTGVLGDVTHSNVQIYDYSSLHQTLKQQNVPQTERNELENILDSLKAAKPEQKPGLIERGKAWIAKNEEFLGATASIVRKAIGISD